MEKYIGINRPYHRNCRPFNNGEYCRGREWMYIFHPKYANFPTQYIQAFLLIQKDLQELFDYITPSDKNLVCYSFRIHELFLRVSIEVEANCKAILIENGYQREDGRDLNMSDYKKLEVTHKLSLYQVKVPYWHGDQAIRVPFAAWAKGDKLNWYEDYHAVKHDRCREFHRAHFGNLIDSVCGLLALLSAQFYTEDIHNFSSSQRVLPVFSGPPNDGMQLAIGKYFQVKFPEWLPEERYSFNNKEWQEMSKELNPFQEFYKK